MKVLILLIFCSACPARPTNSKTVELGDATEPPFQLNTFTTQEVPNENSKTLENFKVKKLNEESLEDLKDMGTKEIEPQQSAVWKDYEKDYWLLKERIPDLTLEEFAEIHKEGATPWNYLKKLDIKKNIKNTNLDPKQILTPIYIIMPIVINGNTTLPLSLSIAGQNIPLNILQADMETSTTRSVENPTTVVNKLNETPTRDTNRHRSNLRKLNLFL